MMKYMAILLLGMVLGISAKTIADEIVYKDSLGSVLFLKTNIRIDDTVKIGSSSYLRYSSKNGDARYPLLKVIEIRFIPFDLLDTSFTLKYSEDLGGPLQTSATAVPTKSVTVSSIAALKEFLADDAIDEIIVANGTYSLASASAHKPTSLWIGTDFAKRTRPIAVRAQTRGGVTFDGGGAQFFCALAFNSGVHDQTWDGLNFVNGTPNSSGIIVFGGFTSTLQLSLPPHNITMRYINIYNCAGSAKTISSPAKDHAVYISLATGGPHDLLFEYWNIDDRQTGGLASAFHFYHSDPSKGYMNAHDVTIRNITVRGTLQAFILMDSTVHDITISDVTVKKALLCAVRFETLGPTGIIFKNIVSTGSGLMGFYSTLGKSPSGVTFINNKFH